MQQRTINRSAKSVNYTLPSPIGGLNARDSLDLMSETDAVVMDNYLPLDTKVALRRGYVRYAASAPRAKCLYICRGEPLLGWGNRPDTFFNRQVGSLMRRLTCHI